jgi:acyl carrier protein
MEMTQVEQVSVSQVFEMLAGAFEEPIENLSPQTLREDIMGWDSMGALALMAELDEKFGLELTADQSKQFKRVDDLLRFLRSHGVLS